MKGRPGNCWRTWPARAHPTRHRARAPKRFPEGEPRAEWLPARPTDKETDRIRSLLDQTGDGWDGLRRRGAKDVVTYVRQLARHLLAMIARCPRIVGKRYSPALHCPGCCKSIPMMEPRFPGRVVLVRGLTIVMQTNVWPASLTPRQQHTGMPLPSCAGKAKQGVSVSN